MPILPTYTAQQNIQARTTAPFREGEAEAALQPAEKITAALTDITQKLSDAHDVMQYSEAKSKWGILSSDIEARAKVDPDFKNSSKYIEELDKAKGASLEGINNQAVANKLTDEFNYDKGITAIKIVSDAKNKQINFTREHVVPQAILDYQKKMISSNTTDAEFKQIQQEMHELINVNVKAGIYSVDEGENLRKKAEVGSAEFAVYSDPENGIKLIEKGRFDLTPEEKTKLIQDAHQVIVHREKWEAWQAEQDEIQSAFDLSEALFNKSLTPAMIRNLQESGKIGTELAAAFESIALNKKYDIPESTSLVEPDYFLRWIDDVNGDKPQIKKILKEAAIAYGENRLGANQYLYFLQGARESFDRKNKGFFGMSHNQTIMKNAVEGIKSFTTNFVGAINSPVEQTKMLLKFIDRFKQGDDPGKIKNEVIEEKLNEEIEKSKLRVTPETVEMISPDGKRWNIPSKNVDKALKRGLKYAR